jgi:hypothetical protein
MFVLCYISVVLYIYIYWIWTECFRIEWYMQFCFDFFVFIQNIIIFRIFFKKQMSGKLLSNIIKS